MMLYQIYSNLTIRATSWFHAAVWSHPQCIPWNPYPSQLEGIQWPSHKDSELLAEDSLRLFEIVKLVCWSSNFVSYTVFSQKELGDPKPVTFPATQSQSICKLGKQDTPNTYHQTMSAAVIEPTRFHTCWMVSASVNWIFFFTIFSRAFCASNWI